MNTVDLTGCWLMQLHIVCDCLFVFDVAWHINYLRSAYYYLQHTNNIELMLYGCHNVYKSNQRWAGLSSDLVI